MAGVPELGPAGPPDPDELARLKARYPRLGAGELGVLAHGLQLKHAGKPYLCVLDDKRARAAAGDLELQFTGCVGLVRLLQTNQVLSPSEAEDLVGRLVAGGFRYKGS